MIRQPTPGKRGRRPISETDNALIEQIRLYLRVNVHHGDIKRLVAAQKGISTRTVEPYIRVAKQRNLQANDRTEGEARADATEYWAKRQLAAENLIRKTNDKIAEIGRLIEAARETADDMTTHAELREAAAQRLGFLLRDQDHHRRVLYQANQDSKESQDRIERILGVHAPQRYAQTDRDGNDLPVSVRQPLTNTVASEMLKEIVDKLRARQEYEQREGKPWTTADLEKYPELR